MCYRSNTNYEEADIDGAEPRYLHDTETVEKRRMLWAAGLGQEIAPGPGEYERDVGGEWGLLGSLSKNAIAICRFSTIFNLQTTFVVVSHLG